MTAANARGGTADVGGSPHGFWNRLRRWALRLLKRDHSMNADTADTLRNASTEEGLRRMMLRKVDPEKLAIKDAKGGVGVEAGLSDSQRQIHQAAKETYNTLLTRYEEYFVAEGDRRADLNIEDQRLRLVRMDTRCEDELAQANLNHVVRVKGAATDHHNALTEYNVFRNEHGLLDRAASYSRSPTLHYGIISLAVLIEAVLNGNFLAGGAELGLVGGILQSIMFSVLNLVLAYLLGKPSIQHLWHSSAKLRWVGVIGVAAFLLACGAYNLIVGHYVDELAVADAASYSTAGSAFTSFLESPFGLVSFNAVLIALAGILFTFFYIAEFFVLDDRYPGYRQVDQEKNRTKEALLALRAMVLGMFEEIRAACDGDCTRLSGKIRRGVANFQRSVNAVEQLGQVLNGIHESILDIRASIAGQYRAKLEGLDLGKANQLHGDLNVLTIETRKVDSLIADDQSKAADHEAFIKDLTALLDDKIQKVGAIARSCAERFADEFDQLCEQHGFDWR